MGRKEVARGLLKKITTREKAKQDVLLKALGKTKKEQMSKLYPKVKGQIRGKGPYVRGTIGKKGADTFLKRRAVMAGTQGKKGADTFIARRAVMSGAKAFPKPTRKKGIVGAAVAGAAGYALGKYGPKKTEARQRTISHADRAGKGVKELIKKQKEKREQRRQGRKSSP